MKQLKRQAAAAAAVLGQAARFFPLQGRKQMFAKVKLYWSNTWTTSEIKITT